DGISVQIHPCLQLLSFFANIRNKLISRKLRSDYDVTNNGSKPCNKKNAANCATNSIHQKVSDTQKGSSISPDHTAARPVMLCTLSSAENVAKDLMLAKQDR
ncbi:unnamed protein product, partial [Staurois parvus]